MMSNNTSQLLITETGHVSLNESSAVRPGCLGTLVGPAADLKEPTRNRRYYSRKLWENVFNTPWIQEALDTKTLFGEVDHPADRLESRIQEAAVVLTEYNFNDATNSLDAKFDILDTPKGRILKSLADYGCQLGVSSRGRGQLTKKGNMQIVSEDGYVFAGFDVVALPAVKKARQSYVSESTSVSSVVESLSSQISKCTTTEELATAKQVLSTSGILDESSELNSLLKVKTSELSKPQDNTIVIEGLKRDLGEAYKEVASLKSQLGSHADTIGKEEITHSDELESCVETINSLVENTLSMKDAETALKLALSDRDKHIATLKEQLDQSTQRVSESLITLGKSKASSKELDESKEIISDLTDSVTSYKSDIDALQSNYDSVVLQLESVTTEHDTLVDEYSDLQESYNTLVDEANELDESVANMKDVMSNSASKYISARCKSAGINESSVTSALNESSTLDEIDSVISNKLDEKVRLSKLSVSTSSNSAVTGHIVSGSHYGEPHYGYADTNESSHLAETKNMLQAFPKSKRPKILKR